MSQLVKTKRQANFKDFKRFGVFKGLVEQKNVVFVCKLALFYHSWTFKSPLMPKRPNLHTNSLNKLLFQLVNKMFLSTAAWIRPYNHIHFLSFQLRNVVHYRTGFIT
jgi:hypothetical protein